MRKRAAKIDEATAGVRRRALRVLIRFVAIAAAAYVVGFEPIVPFFPACYEKGPDGPVRHTIYGAVTDEFAEALRYHQYPENRRHIGGMMLMSIDEWTFGSWIPDELTMWAIWRIVSKRHGLDSTQVFRRQVRLPGFERYWPSCEAVRAIALEGGKWSREGPSPIWYKGAGMPRPEGFVDAQVPHFQYRPDGGLGEFAFACLLVAFAFGAAAGYLLAVWRERNLLRTISMGGLCASIFALAVPLILYTASLLAHEPPFRALFGP